MNELEQFAITMVLGLLQTVIKNPANAQKLEAQLVGIANDIYLAYSMAPPVAAPAPAPAASAPPAAAASVAAPAVEEKAAPAGL